jgi:hypothetical protein
MVFYVFKVIAIAKKTYRQLTLSAARWVRLGDMQCESFVSKYHKYVELYQLFYAMSITWNANKQFIYILISADNYLNAEYGILEAHSRGRAGQINEY